MVNTPFVISALSQIYAFAQWLKSMDLPYPYYSPFIDILLFIQMEYEVVEEIIYGLESGILFGYYIFSN